MANTLNALGDRLLSMFVPKLEAYAIPCRGTPSRGGGGCTYYCYRWGDRSQRMYHCPEPGVRDCTHDCYDCC